MASTILHVLLPLLACVLLTGCAWPVQGRTPPPASSAAFEQPAATATLAPSRVPGDAPQVNASGASARPLAGAPVSGAFSVLTIGSSPAAAAAPAPVGTPEPTPEPLAVLSSVQPNAAPFPGTLLIADAGNNRLLELSPAKQIVWSFPISGSLPIGRSFHYPDDAFFSPDGRYILVNEEYDHVISAIDYAQRKLVWRHGFPGQPGTDLQHFNRPDDAHMLPDGRVVVADIRNCRILIVPWDHQNVQSIGRPGDCSGHAGSLAKPNGVTVLPNGHLLVTEIASQRASEMNLQGKPVRSVKLPLYYPSDAFLTPRDTLIVADYHTPGRVIEADWQGHVLWSYPSAGSGERLDRPSIAFELPNGNIIVADDHRHRVIVVDRAGRVLWQYGVTDRPGTGPGYLNTPDGLDLHWQP